MNALLLTVTALLTATPLADALPAATSEVLMVDPIRGNLDPAIDFLERSLGYEFSEDFLASAPLPRLALEALSGAVQGEHGVDVNGGLGLFRLPGFEGAIGIAAASDEAAAVRATRAHLVEHGGRELPALFQSVRVEVSGAEAYLFSHQGHVYVVMPDERYAGPAEQDPTGAVIRGLKAKGGARLGTTPLWKQLRHRAGTAGALTLFRRLEESAAAGAMVQLTFHSNRAIARGFVQTKTRLLPRKAASAQNPLRRAGEAPVVVASTWLAREALEQLVLGDAGSWERRWAKSQASVLGFDLTKLLGAMGDRATFLGYFDSELYWANVLDGMPLPYASVKADVEVRDAAHVRSVAKEVLERSAAAAGFVPTQTTPQLLRMERDGEVLELQMTPDAAALSLGASLAERRQVPLLEKLERRFGRGTFGPGHVSVLFDLATLRAQLDRPIDLGELSEEEAEALQRAALALVWQVEPVEFLFLDLAAAPGGLEVRGELRFGQRRPTAGGDFP